MTLTHERLLQMMRYEPDTGDFYWIEKRNGVVPGKIKPCTSSSHGYRSIGVSYRRYLAHRLAWFYMTGDWPSNHIDHIDGNRENNRWSNLREADRSQNLSNRPAQSNNRSGFKGVCCGRNGWYSAQIQSRGVTYYLGMSKRPEEAHELYLAAARRLHGEFARA